MTCSKGYVVCTDTRAPHFYPKLNKTIVIHFIRPDKILEADECQTGKGRDESADKVNKSRKRGWRIKMENSLQKHLIPAAICVCVCFYVFGLEMAGQMGNE